MVNSIHPDITDATIDGIDQNCDGIDGIDVDGDGEADCYDLQDMDCDGIPKTLDCDDNHPLLWQDTNADGVCDKICSGSYVINDSTDIQEISHCVVITGGLDIVDSSLMTHQSRIGQRGYSEGF